MHRVRGVRAASTWPGSIPRVRGSVSMNTGVRPHWSTEAMSDTQAKVARLLDGGMKPAEIAQKLGVSVEAVYLHRRQLKKV